MGYGERQLKTGERSTLYKKLTERREGVNDAEELIPLSNFSLCDAMCSEELISKKYRHQEEGERAGWGGV